MCTVNPCVLLSPQRGKSIPAFLSSKPGKECKEGQRICAESWALSPLKPNQGAAPFTTSQKHPQDGTAQRNELPDPSVKVHGQSKSTSGWTETRGSGKSRETSRRQNKVNIACESRKRQNFKVRFDEIPNSNSPRISGITAPPLEGPELQPDGEKRPTGMTAHPRTAETGGCGLLLADASVDLHSDLSKRDKALQGSASRPRVLPRLPVPSGRGEAGALALLELQDSFSKSAAHRSFSSSITGAAAGLSDRRAPGRKHNFFGINCYYLRGWVKQILGLWFTLLTSSLWNSLRTNWSYLQTVCFCRLLNILGEYCSNIIKRLCSLLFALLHPALQPVTQWESYIILP